MGETKRPIKDIIQEKIGWLEKQCRDKNNTLLSDNFDSSDVSIDGLNAEFVKAIKGLREARTYLMSDMPPRECGSHGDGTDE